MIALINHQGLKVVAGIAIQTPAPPLGLAYIGSYLKKNGYNYKSIDACGEALDQISKYKNSSDIVIQGLTNTQVLERLSGKEKIIGLGCIFSHVWPLVFSIIKDIKAINPDVIIVVGGEHPTGLTNDCLRHPEVDIVVTGEGEETFLELVQKIDKGDDWRNTTGISYRTSTGEIIHNNRRQRVTKINDFPYPDWDSWFIENYIKFNQVTGLNLGRSLPILGSRGCPYTCTFCSSEAMWTTRYIFREPAKIVDEMEFFQKKYHLDGFNFMDLTFIIDRKKVLDFTDEIINRNLKIVYQLPVGTRSEVINDELVFALQKSGLKNFAFAPESGDIEILKKVQKRINLDKFLKAVDSVLKTDMTISCFFVIGFPDDTKQSLKKTLSLIRKLAIRGVHDVSVSQFTPYPGSKLFQELVDDGSITKDYSELESIINFYTSGKKSYCNSFNSKQMYQWMMWMLLNFYIISFIVRPWRVTWYFWLYMTKGFEMARYMRFFTEFFVNRKTWKHHQ
jgi:anaerobic magnesium-protoporphyrin IX monomethyl ester cyclase